MENEIEFLKSVGFEVDETAKISSTACAMYSSVCKSFKIYKPTSAMYWYLYFVNNGNTLHGQKVNVAQQFNKSDFLQIVKVFKKHLLADIENRLASISTIPTDF
jgi:hypothetical protein